MLSGCWNDDCDPACEPGTSCYYGVCLSRAFCEELGPCERDSDCRHGVSCIREPGEPTGECDDHATNCASYDASGACEFRVGHGICDRGYACVCVNDEFNLNGECTSYRACRTDGSGD